jgi:simple sugar transport system permease protein
MKPQLLADKQLAFLVAVNLLIVVLATAWSGGQFVGVDNLQSMASQVPELGLLSIGVTLAMISGNGGIDLSGVALANLAAVLAGVLVPHWVSPEASPVAYTVAFVLVALVTGVAGGAFNGLLISRVRLTPILATLGTQLLFTGIAVVLTNGSTVRIGYVEPLAAIGNETVLGVPIPFCLFFAVILTTGAVLKRSAFGVRLFLMGTNPKAARYAGIPQPRMLMLTYTACGALAAMAGIVIASRTASAKWDYGSSYLLITILITVMAGVKPAGGYGRMSCLFFSATALQVLSSTFNLVGISNFFRDCAWGLLLLLFLASTHVLPALMRSLGRGHSMRRHS